MNYFSQGQDFRTILGIEPFEVRKTAEEIGLIALAEDGLFPGWALQSSFWLRRLLTSMQRKIWPRLLLLFMLLLAGYPFKLGHLDGAGVRRQNTEFSISSGFWLLALLNSFLALLSRFELMAILSVPQTIEFWRQRNGCGAIAPLQQRPTSQVTITRYTQCQSQGEVELVTLVGAGHVFPRGGGGNTGLIDGSQEVWRFFQHHSSQHSAQ